MSWGSTHTFSVGEVLTAANMNLIQANINAVAPVGSLKFVVGTSAGNAVESVWQSGWLECNAASVSRSTYAALDTYLAAQSPARPFGTVDGSHVTLPDFQGRFPVHHTVGGHADVGTLGGSDGVVYSTRRPKHRTSNALTTSHNLTLPNHTHPPAAGSFVTMDSNSGDNITNTITGGGNDDRHIQTGNPNSLPSINGSVTITGSLGTATAGDSLDSSPYLVAGIWIIKF